MFCVSNYICSKSKEMANTSIYSQMSCVIQNVIVFHICAQNCCCLSKTQQLEMEQGVVLVSLEDRAAQAEALLLFPFLLFLKAELKQHNAEAPFCFLLFFSFFFSWGCCFRQVSKKLHFTILKLLQGKFCKYLSTWNSTIACKEEQEF